MKVPATVDDGAGSGPAFDATIETNPNPIIASNIRHDISAQYDYGKFAVRVGVNNFTDKQPSYPQIAYGDILGRRWFLGLNAKL